MQRFVSGLIVINIVLYVGFRISWASDMYTHAPPVIRATAPVVLRCRIRERPSEKKDTRSIYTVPGEVHGSDGNRSTSRAKGELSI